MWRIIRRHKFPHRCKIVEMLQSQPNCFRARLAITLASKKTTESGYHSHCRAQGWRLGWRDGLLRDVSAKGLPFRFFKKYRAGHIRSFPAQLDQVEDAPSDDHVDSQTGLDAVGTAQLALFDLASTFEGAMIGLDSPSPGVPNQFLVGLRKAGHFT